MINFKAQYVACNILQGGHMSITALKSSKHSSWAIRHLTWRHLSVYLPLPTPEVGSDNEEYLPTVDLDDPVWSEEPVPDNWEYLCIHLTPRPATPPPQPNQVEMPPEPKQPALQPPQPNQVVMLPPVSENMDIDIPEDIPDFINIPEEILSDFDAWAHSVPKYQL